MIFIVALFVVFLDMSKTVELTVVLAYATKIFALIVVYTCTKRYSEFGWIFILRYGNIFLYSLIISIPIWITVPQPEFIFYDGSEMRFAGLHFELFNLSLSLCIFLTSWLFAKKNKYIGLMLFLYFGYLSGSNMFPLFALVFVIPRWLLKWLKIRFYPV